MYPLSKYIVHFGDGSSYTVKIESCVHAGNERLSAYTAASVEWLCEHHGLQCPPLDLIQKSA